MNAPHFDSPHATIWHGDCIDVMRGLPDASVDAVVTDPPYGLEFMGKDWDSFKPGGKRPQIGDADGTPFRRTTGTPSWAASGNPRCTNCGGTKYDRTRDNGCKCEAPRFPNESAAHMRAFQDWCEDWATEALRVLKPGGHLLAFGGTRTYHRLTAGIEDAGFEIRDSIAWMYGSGFPKSLDVSKAIDKMHGAERTEVIGSRGLARWKEGAPGGVAMKNDGGIRQNFEKVNTLLAPVTEQAVAWQGWGTALKPAFEPIVVARKPLTGTVAANVLAHGTGALNIDATRIPMSAEDAALIDSMGGFGAEGAVAPQGAATFASKIRTGAKAHQQGRWPANVILDESQAAALDAQSGIQRDGVAVNRNRNAEALDSWYGTRKSQTGPDIGYGGSGGASRFFYTAKADSTERPTYWIPTCNCETVKPCPLQPRDTTGSESDDETSWNTSTSGNSTTAPSPTDTTSTTATRTSSTTGSRTSNSSPASSTNGSTADANSATANGGSHAVSAASSSPSTSPTGTSVPKVGPSTAAAAPATSARSWTPNACANCGAPHKREAHATVKPLDLMRWLVRLVTPKGGTVLEPFAGSGTTVEAAVLEGFRCIAIEREATYLPLIMQRLDKPHAVGLDFGDWEDAS